MPEGTRYDVSVVIPFRDDEDLIGSAVLSTAAYLRELAIPFEIVAVDEDSGDNTHAVLALLRGQVPELRVLHSPLRGRGCDAGVARAQGRVLWIIDALSAQSSLTEFRAAFQQVIDDQCDAVVIRGRFTVAHRVRILSSIEGVAGLGDALHRRLARRLASRGLRVDVQDHSPRRQASRSLLRMALAVWPSAPNRARS